MPASVFWGILTLLTTAYAYPHRALTIPLGVFCAIIFTQAIGDVTPLNWAAIDLLALTGAFVLYHQGDKLALILSAILTARLLLHLQQLATPFDLYTYYLTANLLYGALLVAILGWTFRYSHRWPLFR